MASSPPAVLVAPNAYKGTLSAYSAAVAIARGCTSEAPGITVQILPVADGGNGMLDVLLHSARGSSYTVHTVPGPLGTPVSARLGWLSPTHAVVELAESSGIVHLVPTSQTSRTASSYGCGILIAEACRRGAQDILVGLGGSSSTDGGTGLLAALGARFLDRNGTPLPPGGAALQRLSKVDLSRAREAVRNVRITVAVDVDAPLLGPHGAAAQFGPQKGATPSDAAVLDDALANFASLLPEEDRARAVHPGAGAAGGTGFGLSLLGAELAPGAGLVLDTIGFNAALEEALLVITGEGTIDSTTLQGKAPYEVARRSRTHGVPCFAIGGKVTLDPSLSPFTGCVDCTSVCQPNDPRNAPRRALREAARSLIHELGVVSI